MKYIWSVVLVMLAQIAVSSAAFADISVCNDFRKRIRIALAYEDGSGFHASGWWAVQPNTCRDVDYPFQGTALYYTAESDSYREGGKTVQDHWGNKKELFVGTGDFEFDRADQGRNKGKPVMFSRAEIAERLQNKPIVITLRFTSGNTTISMKTKSSSAALAEISICNNFKARIRVALAAEDSGGFHTAGWWGIAPGACRDVDFPFRGSALYYTADSDSYREGRKTMQYHWGNKKELYVGNGDFEFDNADRRRRGAKAMMFSRAEVAEHLQSKPIKIMLGFAKGSTTISMKPN